MTVQRCYGAVVKEITNVEELLIRQAVLLAMLGIGSHVVELAESGSEGDMTCVVQAGLGELDNTILCSSRSAP